MAAEANRFTALTVTPEQAHAEHRIGIIVLPSLYL